MRGLKSSPALEKAYQLAKELVPVCRGLSREPVNRILAEQVLRACTSVGANLAEAQSSISRADFSAKIGIAYKEITELKYWLNLLFDIGLLDSDDFFHLLAIADEVGAMLSATLKTARFSQR